MIYSSDSLGREALEHPPLRLQTMAKNVLSIVVIFLFSANMAYPAAAQTIQSVQPRQCKPGQTIQLSIQGTDLNDSLRLVAGEEVLSWKAETIEATKATISLTISQEATLGPKVIWLATSTGVVTPHTLFVDDLDAVSDNGANHTIETAQPLNTHASVSGICDAAASDFYRFHASPGERVAVEIHTQALRSTMDPVIRLLDAEGEMLHQADDTAVGPDCAFRYQFTSDGDYILEVHDSQHASAGASYQLRIGDFPIVNQCYPLAVRAGEATTISFLGPDGATLSSTEVTLPNQNFGMIRVPARFEQGRASSWAPLWNSPHAQFVESDDSVVLSLPVGISGRLRQPGESDSYRIHGEKSQVVRVAAKTRSLGSPTMLQMTLWSAGGAKVAETKISDADEWSFDATLPETGEYRLEVSDLLKRGGDDFAYYIECIPAGTFTVTLKPDPKTRETFAIESEHGACALDLQISRFGFAEAIELTITNPQAGIEILNPHIPANATEARVYLLANDGWTTGSLTALQIVASSVNGGAVQTVVDSGKLRRVKEPHVLAPQTGTTGTIVLAATDNTDSPFTMQPTTPLRFARPLRALTATFTLQRLQESFKSNVELLTGSLPAGWSGSTAIEKDSYKLAIARGEGAAVEPDAVTLQAYGEWNGRGRIETVSVPVAWFDPVRVDLKFPEPFVRGGRIRATAQLTREGDDPQPVTIRFDALPAGLTGPDAITIAADQSAVDFELQLAANASLTSPAEAMLVIASQFRGTDFSVTSSHPLPEIVDGPAEISIYPSEIALSDARDRQQLVVTGRQVGGDLRDWTRDAQFKVSDPSIAQVKDGVVFPLADGKTEIVIEVGATRQHLPVRVSNMATPRRIDFESEVLVALSKQGCNSGACHGSPSGKGGFRLSLRAFDKNLDELTLIREDFGRRNNLLDPENSLLLLKPLMRIAHGGGKQLHKEDEAYAILRDWIAEGAAPDPSGTPRVKNLEVHPPEKHILAAEVGGQQIAVTAHFEDGRSRDVTHLVAYETSDTSVATVDPSGLVTPHAQGEAAILVRFLEHIEAVPLMFIQRKDDFEWAAPTPTNYIDTLVQQKLKQLQYNPAETCSDDEFLRRVSLDVLGILPSVEETRAFLADTRADKRARLIDALLEREEHAKFWALKWGDLLRMTKKQVGDQGVFKYHRWVETAIDENMPYDEFARRLLTGSGSTLANPPANFYRTATDMNECVETISQVFLGARLQCAKCHNHPFERWTQDNYYGLAAFFNRVKRRKTERPGEMFVYASDSGDVTQPRTGQVLKPWLPLQGSISPPADEDLRAVFADWLVSPDNPYFARIEANRIWSQLFARGIVDPIDDFRDSNPPTNAALLDALAKDFIESGYDRKHLIRVILNSQTYQASYQTTQTNADDIKYFSHQEPRLLSAEQLLDAINRTLAVEQKLGGLPAGTLATHIPAPDLVKVDFLKVFGQPERSTVCACERAEDSNLGMAIELFNGPLIHAKLRDPNNRFRRGIAEGKKVEDVVTELYLVAVCRPPSDIEMKTAVEHCSKSPDPASGVEDLCWALFNTDEFLFQH